MFVTPIWNLISRVAIVAGVGVTTATVSHRISDKSCDVVGNSLLRLFESRADEELRIATERTNAAIMAENLAQNMRNLAAIRTNGQVTRSRKKNKRNNKRR